MMTVIRENFFLDQSVFFLTSPNVFYFHCEAKRQKTLFLMALKTTNVVISVFRKQRFQILIHQK